MKSEEKFLENLLNLTSSGSFDSNLIIGKNKCSEEYFKKRSVFLGVGIVELIRIKKVKKGDLLPPLRIMAKTLNVKKKSLNEILCFLQFIGILKRKNNEIIINNDDIQIVYIFKNFIANSTVFKKGK